MRIHSLLGLAATLMAMAVSGPGVAHAGSGQPPAVSIAADDFHELVNTATDKCVDVVKGSKETGARVHQWDCERDPSQLWASIDLGNGFVQFVNKNSGKCLSLVWGTLVVDQQSCNATDQRQWWQWAPADVFGNLVLVTPPAGGSACLALLPFSHRNGTRIGIADCATTSSQIWHSE